MPRLLKTVYIGVDCEGDSQKLCSALVALLHNLNLDDVGKLSVSKLSVHVHSGLESQDKASWRNPDCDPKTTRHIVRNAYKRKTS